MGFGHVLGLVFACAMLLGGGFLALAGMGYVGNSSDTSQTWAMLGSLLAGLGVALGITVVKNRR